MAHDGGPDRLHSRSPVKFSLKSLLMLHLVMLSGCGRQSAAPSSPPAGSSAVAERAERAEREERAQELLPPDVDQEGTLTIWDNCLDEQEVVNGFEDYDGCEDEMPVSIHDLMGALPFSPRSAALSAPVKARLDALAASMGWYEGRAASIRHEMAIRVVCRPGEDPAGERLERRRKAAIVRRLRAHGVRELYFERQLRHGSHRSHGERVQQQLEPGTCLVLGFMQELMAEEELDPVSKELADTWEGREPDNMYWWRVLQPPLKVLK